MGIAESWRGPKLCICSFGRAAPLSAGELTNFMGKTCFPEIMATGPFV